MPTAGVETGVLATPFGVEAGRVGSGRERLAAGRFAFTFRLGEEAARAFGATEDDDPLDVLDPPDDRGLEDVPDDDGEGDEEEDGTGGEKEEDEAGGELWLDEVVGPPVDFVPVVAAGAGF